MNKRNGADNLVSLATTGDTEALAELFQRYRDRLSRMVRVRMDYRLHGRLDVSDVLQDSFLDASRRLPEYVAAPNISLFLWLRSLTLQRLIDLHRQHLGARMRSVAMEVPFQNGKGLTSSSRSLAKFLIDSSLTPGTRAIRAEMQHRIHQSLESMEPIDREVLTMRHFELLTNTEVAELLNLTKAGASNRYVRALQRLHATLHGDFDDSK